MSDLNSDMDTDNGQTGNESLETTIKQESEEVVQDFPNDVHMQDCEEYKESNDNYDNENVNDVFDNITRGENYLQLAITVKHWNFVHFVISHSLMMMKCLTMWKMNIMKK